MSLGNRLQSFFTLALLWASIGLCQNLGTLFNVKTGTTNGGCDNRAGTLQSWLTDTFTLVTTVLNAMPDDPTQIGNDQALKNNLGAFFGIRFTQGGTGSINRQDVNAYTGVKGMSMSNDI
jgi:hypothetical protein